MPKMLDDATINQILSLMNAGEEDEAWDVIQSCLNEHPDNLELRFLKAKLCLDLGRELGFAGHTLLELQSKRQYQEQMTALLERAETLAGEKLAEGRGKLQRGYLRDAVGHFNTACDLLPADPAIPLAAALALLGDEGESPDEIDSLLDILSRTNASLSSSKADATERFLNLALQRSRPGQQAYTKAGERLVQFWLAQQQTGKAMAWLAAHEDHLNAIDVHLITGVHRHALATMLDTAAHLLRNDKLRAARKILRACRKITPHTPMLHLLTAEAALLAGHPDRAMTAYRKGLNNATPNPDITDNQIMQQAWNTAQNHEVICANCGKTIKLPANNCPLCTQALRQRDLLIDQFGISGVSESFLADAALAELLADQNRHEQALHHLNAALARLPQQAENTEVITMLRQKKIDLEQRITKLDSDTLNLHDLCAQPDPTPAALAQITHVCDTEPTLWHDIPLKPRLKLGRTLIHKHHLGLARKFLETAFSEKSGRKSVARLSENLNETLQSQTYELVQEARQSLDAGHVQQALHLAGEALALRPQHHMALFIRGEARRQLGHNLTAIADFHEVITASDDSALVHAARLATAKALEQQHEVELALETLAGMDSSDVQQARTRLERLKRGEPVVHIQSATHEVMYDTLARVASTAVFQGYFAIAVRSVGRPWNATASEWAQNNLKALFEFIQILGGLRNIVGTPLFALRFISQPHPHIPERGHLNMALLVRVSAENREVCQQRALDLWDTLRGMLPAQHTYTYLFDPVADEHELSNLLEPFEISSIAEIVRREDTHHQHENQQYTVYPFTAGTLDLHNLCWALLRQPTPAMVSIHLQPGELMPWERTAFDHIMQTEPVPVARQQQDTGDVLVDPVSQWWQGMPRWKQAHANRRLVDSMPSQAYLLSINVASRDTAGSLLPETVASALFGPANPASDTRFGGYEVLRAGSADELQIAISNVTTLDMERWVYSAAPERLQRLRYLMSENEAVLAFRLPIPGKEGLPGVPLLDAKPVPPPAGLPPQGLVLGESVTRAAGLPLRITQATEDRRRHTYVLGKTGVGKTTLLQAMALQDIEAGHGVCVVDPHGDLTDDLLLRIPAHRASDVILFDPSDDERPVGLNLLAASSESEKSQIVNEFIGLLIRMYDPHETGIVGPRFQHNVRNAMLTVMSLEDSTLIEAVRALTDQSYVKSILPFVKDPLVRNYWEKQIANTSDYHRSEILDYIVSKFSRFVGDERVRNIIGQRHTTLNFRQIMDRRQILLVNLSKGKIGSENAQFLGLLLVQQLLITALSRAALPVGERPDFFLYVDEFQNFATDLFATMLSEGRKYGVAVVVANQYLNQLDASIREAIFGNVGSMVSFRLGTQDATAMAPEMYPSLDADDLINLPKYTACVKLLVDGVASKPFTMRTLPDLRLPDPQRAAAIRQHSRQTYGSDAALIGQDILSRFKS